MHKMTTPNMAIASVNLYYSGSSRNDNQSYDSYNNLLDSTKGTKITQSTFQAEANKQ